ncbi:MAG: hypothetical protein LUI87_05760 [Lachnospiraceae bacterium]|nr:hypothetical protein [Lachnospiraceae bacterium]
MTRIANKFGGGSRTNANGLYFEQTTSLDDALRNAGYTVEDCCVYRGKEQIGMSVQKRNLYTKFLARKGIDYNAFNSKQWQPDECFINYENQTAFIIEKKFQNSAGSVDEKLPGCHFKKQEYEKLFHPLGYKVEYLYIFNDWFHDPKYLDTLEYIRTMGCYYFFNEVPLNFLKISEVI